MLSIMAQWIMVAERSGRVSDDGEADAGRGGMLQEARLAAAVHPPGRHRRVRRGEPVGHVLAAVGVLHRGGGDYQGQQQPEGVGGDVLLPPLHPLARVISLRGLRGIGGGLHHPGADDCRGRLRCAPGLLADPAAEQVVDRLGGAVGLPPGVVVIHGLARREVVRQVPPGDPGPVHVQDRVHDLAQVMDRRGKAQAGLGAGGPPGGQDRLDQRPPGIGQVTTICTPASHDRDL
jgi:hypothetical protein